MSTSTSSRVIVAYVNAHGGLTTLGAATVKGNRCTLEQRIAETFPKGTATYEQIKKACKWLVGESAAVSVDFTAKRGMELKAIKL